MNCIGEEVVQVKDIHKMSVKIIQVVFENIAMKVEQVSNFNFLFNSKVLGDQTQFVQNLMSLLGKQSLENPYIPLLLVLIADG